jgi:hypothetical protein
LRACGRTLLSRTGNLGAKIKDTDTQIEDVAAAYQQIAVLAYLKDDIIVPN